MNGPPVSPSIALRGVGFKIKPCRYNIKIAPPGGAINFHSVDATGYGETSSFLLLISPSPLGVRIKIQILP